MTPETGHPDHTLTTVTAVGSSDQPVSFAGLRAQYAALDQMTRPELQQYTRSAARWLSAQTTTIEQMTDRVHAGADLSSPDVLELSTAFEHVHSCQLWIEHAIARLKRLQRRGKKHGV